MLAETLYKVTGEWLAVRLRIDIDALGKR